MRRWLRAREGGEAAAGVRVGVALAVVWNLVDLAGAGPELLSTQAYRPPQPDQWLLSLLDPVTPQVFWGLEGCGAVLALALLAGLGGRWTALVLLQVMLALFDINGHLSGGHDRLTTAGLWLVFLSQPTATWSLDCWLRTGSWQSDRAVPRWPRDLAIVQLALMYSLTGWQKLDPAWFPWGDYRALWLALHNPVLSRFGPPASWTAPLLAVGTAVTWVFEATWIVAAVATWKRWTRVRNAYLVLGVLLHVGIVGLMDVGSFSIAALALYPALLSPPGRPSVAAPQPAA
jgi:hypothetical protein